MIADELKVDKEKATAFVHRREVQAMLRVPEQPRIVRAYRRPEVIHGIFDDDDNYECASKDLREVINELGYPFVAHKLGGALQDAQRALADVPRDAIIWRHYEGPRGQTVDSDGETPNLVLAWIESEFERVVGSSAAFVQNTNWKSRMGDLMAAAHVPHAPHVLLRAADEARLDKNVRALLASLGFPTFSKVDDGCNSVGLGALCIANDIDELAANVAEMIATHGPIVVQKMLKGREFTVAVAKNRAFAPIERIFDDGQLFSGPGGTKRERIMVPEDEASAALIAEIQRVALAAFDAVGGEGYGRVDLREDPDSKAIYALETNCNCSFAKNSYFDMSAKAVGLSRDLVAYQILMEVL